VGFDIATAVVVADGARVTLTYATTPEAIVWEFNPVTMQADEPEADAQVTNLPAAVATGPGDKEIPVI
jgi:hypothetical protein